MMVRKSALRLRDNCPRHSAKFIQLGAQTVSLPVQLVEKASVKMLKEGEDQKIKIYTALCVCPDGGGDDFDAVKERLESLKASYQLIEILLI